MTLDKARELLAVQVDFGGGYNRIVARPILHEVHRAHGRAGVGTRIRELQFDQRFGLQPGSGFSKGIQARRHAPN